MTKSKRGAIAFTACGAEHQLHLNTNALVRYQDLFGETLVQGVQALNDTPGDIRRVRRILYVGIDRDQSRSEEDVGDLIDDLGLPQASELIGKAVQAAFPNAEGGADAEAGQGSGNGQKPPAKKAAKTS